MSKREIKRKLEEKKKRERRREKEEERKRGEKRKGENLGFSTVFDSDRFYTRVRGRIPVMLYCICICMLVFLFWWRRIERIQGFA